MATLTFDTIFILSTLDQTMLVNGIVYILCIAGLSTRRHAAHMIPTADVVNDENSFRIQRNENFLKILSLQCFFLIVIIFCGFQNTFFENIDSK